MKVSSTKYGCLRVDSGLKRFTDLIIDNSWVRQPDLALGGALSLFAVLASRKFIYQGLAPNLYVANISPSGTGKSFPQEEVRKALMRCGAMRLIGAGDYASYASLMDRLPHNPVRLDILDEVGGILKVVTKGGQDYSAKMDDVLAELYTVSNSYYAGRALAESVKGQCMRPNVNILGSTTPKGFEEGVSQTAIDKGLIGRFVFFQGDPKAPAKRVGTIKQTDGELTNHLEWLRKYKPEEDPNIVVNGIDQLVTDLGATSEANEMLDVIFKEFDDNRISNLNTAIGPIIARAYQQMIKFVIIHAVSREFSKIPVINKDDVLFGYESILLQIEDLKDIVGKLIFSTNEEKDREYVLKNILDHGKVYKKDLIRLTPKVSRSKRNSIISELIELEDIVEDVERTTDNKLRPFYIGGKNEL